MNHIVNNTIVRTFNSFANLFDKLNNLWGNNKSLKIIGGIIVFSFLSTLFLIQIKIWGLLPYFLQNIIPVNHFFAIDVAFTFLLIVLLVS